VVPNAVKNIRGFDVPIAEMRGWGRMNGVWVLPAHCLPIPSLVFAGSGSQPNCCHWPSRSLLTVISFFQSASRNRLMPVADTALPVAGRSW